MFKEGALILVGNHSNQFIDPMMIMTKCDRKISFTMAASSFNKPVIAGFARQMNVIPVSRPEDSKIKGQGTIKFKSSTEIEGTNTKFLEQSSTLKTGVGGIMIKNKTFVIDKINNNDFILIKENLDEYNSLLNEYKEREYEYYLIPKTDNKVLFSEVYKKLSENGCICIFPEGTSHDRTEFIKLKAGVALMALGAMADHGCSDIKILPVGLNYFNRDKIRSDAIIEFGKPFTVPVQWAEEYKTKKREATEKLLNEVEAVNLILNNFLRE